MPAPSPTQPIAPRDLRGAIRQFIIDQARDRTDETRRRYVRVADDLDQFLASVDIAPYLGRQLADHLASRRAVEGNDAFLVSLGLIPLIRVLPAFVKDPWLAPAFDKQRGTQRTAVRHLMRFLRAQARAVDALHREDFAAIDRALGHSNDWGYGYQKTIGRDDRVSCTVTIDLVQHFVDRMLEQVTRGEFETLDAAIAHRLNPVQVTEWRYPDDDLYAYTREWPRAPRD